MKVREKLERAALRYYPPSLAKEGFFCDAFLILLIPAFAFLIQLLMYVDACEDLYTWVGGHRTVRMDVRIAAFSRLFAHGCACFWFSLIAAFVVAAQNYLSFRRGSMSVYLMRRLPDAADYHRRALALPISAAALAFLETVLLYLLLNLIYRFLTPPLCLGDPSLALWRAFL